MRLSKFITENTEAILQEWEDFAVTLYPLNSASKVQLRDHAKGMLQVICVDLDTYQGVQAGIDKSKGRAPESSADTAAESHAEDRLRSGFSVEELMAEYRALRASVLRLWQDCVKQADGTDLQDMLRFNEAIDQSLTESIARYSSMLRDSQSVFLAILGHDIRNPLGAISMGSQLILQDQTLPEQHLKVAQQVLKSTERVNDIVSDLLDFSASHLGGGIPVTMSDFELSVECESVVQEMKMFHPECDVRLDIASPINVHWDRPRICQALSNLLANAVQHGAKGCPIWIKISVEGDHVLWVVRNEGELITPAKLRTMFDPAKSFAIKSASERSASQSDNLGLGLYITHEIVRAHNGAIWVSSTEGEGTTLSVNIPKDGGQPR